MPHNIQEAGDTTVSQTEQNQNQNQPFPQYTSIL